ncbi:MAG: hypothetical protein AAF409_18360 [Pseudomonadota bacterium]
MRTRSIAAAAAAVLVSAGVAQACTTLDEAMGDFRSVADAFSAQAQSMSPDKFPIWTSEVQKFSDAMGQQNFPEACGVLVSLVEQLDLDVALQHAGAPAAPAAPAPSGDADTAGVPPPRGGSDSPQAAPEAETAGVPATRGDSTSPQVNPPQVEAPQVETPTTQPSGGGWDTPTRQAETPAAPAAPAPQPQIPVAGSDAPTAEPAVMRPGRDRARPPRLW